MNLEVGAVQLRFCLKMLSSIKNKKFVRVILGGLIGLNILAWIVVYNLSQPRFLEVIFFDVGQGDAIFIETPQGHQILIDGGPDLTVLEKLAEEMPFYDRKIDLIILTHPEHDHLFGLLEVLKRYEIKYILWTGVVRETAEWQEWKRLVEIERAKVKIAKFSQKIILQEDPFVFIDVLYPFENLEGQEFENSNDTSIVARLVFSDDSFLFTGDIAKEVEGKLVNRNINLDTDVLKVAHHGSKTSSFLEFLEAVSPEIAVIQVGKDNSYGHPHPEVLANLEQFGIHILRTDINGDIKIVSNGNNFKFIK